MTRLTNVLLVLVVLLPLLLFLPTQIRSSCCALVELGVTIYAAVEDAVLVVARAAHSVLVGRKGAVPAKYNERVEFA